MKRVVFLVQIFVLGLLIGYGQSKPTGLPANADGMGTNQANGAGVEFKLGLQMWTFKEFSFTEALKKVDSSGIKNIEVFIQKLGGGLPGNFDTEMSKDTRDQLKKQLKSLGIQIVAMGVVTPKTEEDWRKTFELARDFGMRYIVSEPNKTQWGLVDRLAGTYGIPVAIHDHPYPNPYWSPDSVLAALIDHPHLGACADVGHWARNGLNPVECLKKLDGHIIDVHFKDIVQFNNTKAADTVVSLGVIDFPPILAELKRQHFKGMVTIEHESNWLNNVPDVIFTRKYYDSVLATL